LYQLLYVALSAHKTSPGVSDIVQSLAAWYTWTTAAGGSVGRYATFYPADLHVLYQQAIHINDAHERVMALAALCKLAAAPL
jgi:hypothetical protein